HVSLEQPAASVFRVRLYTDPQRTPETLIAEGTRSSAQGTVQLAGQNGSGLSGSFNIAYTAGSTSIAVLAVSNLLSWRLQRLRIFWAAQDRLVDLYSNGVLPKELQALPRPPIVDPDVIGADDFRHPIAKTVPHDPDSPFDLWLRRRQWVDTQLGTFEETTKLVDGQFVPDLAAMLDAMYQPVTYGVTSITPWQNTTLPTDFDTLLDQLAQDPNVAAAEVDAA